MNADPQVMEFFPSALSRAHSDAVAGRIRAELAGRAFGLWAVEVVNGAPFIGFVGLNVPGFEAPFTPCVELGWRLSVAQWGRGYATEAARRATEYAFAELGLEQLVSFTSTNNVRSQLVMQRLGMTSDRAENFKHPLIRDGDPLQEHVLYRPQRGAWLRQANQ